MVVKFVFAPYFLLVINGRPDRELGSTLKFRYHEDDKFCMIFVRLIKCKFLAGVNLMVRIKLK